MGTFCKTVVQPGYWHEHNLLIFLDPPFLLYLCMHICFVLWNFITHVGLCIFTTLRIQDSAITTGSFYVPIFVPLSAPSHSWQPLTCSSFHSPVILRTWYKWNLLVYNLWDCLFSLWVISLRTILLLSRSYLIISMIMFLSLVGL